MNYQGNNAHEDSLNIGHEFQDYVVEKLSKIYGISVTVFQSKKYQFSKGESLQGVEIKYDSRSTGDCTYNECNATKNVAIEVAEKSSKSVVDFSPSGIYRLDNTWLYIVGNYHQFWAFNKKHLQELNKSNIYKTIETLPTIRTMLLPINIADKICCFKFIEAEQKNIF
jgi:hypothetical protein